MAPIVEQLVHNHLDDFVRVFEVHVRPAFSAGLITGARYALVDYATQLQNTTSEGEDAIIEGSNSTREEDGAPPADVDTETDERNDKSTTSVLKFEKSSKEIDLSRTALFGVFGLLWAGGPGYISASILYPKMFIAKPLAAALFDCWVTTPLFFFPSFYLCKGVLKLFVKTSGETDTEQERDEEESISLSRSVSDPDQISTKGFAFACVEDEFAAPVLSSYSRNSSKKVEVYGLASYRSSSKLSTADTASLDAKLAKEIDASFEASTVASTTGERSRSDQNTSKETIWESESTRSSAANARFVDRHGHESVRSAVDFLWPQNIGGSNGDEKCPSNLAHSKDEQDRSGIIGTAFQEWRGNFLEDNFANSAVWIPMNWANYSYTPLQHRALVGSLAGIVWGVVFSTLRGKENKTTTTADEQEQQQTSMQVHEFAFDEETTSSSEEDACESQQ